MAVISALGQSLGPEFVGDYSFSSLGSVPGLPANYGGLVFKADDPDTILIGGAANGGSGAIYALGVIRDSGTNSIVGFTGPAVFYASASGIDGGLVQRAGNNCANGATCAMIQSWLGSLNLSCWNQIKFVILNRCCVAAPLNSV